MADYSRPSVIAITGATSGLGEALALEYAAEGATLVLHGRDDTRLQAVTARCRARGAQVVTCLADLRDAPAFMQSFGAAIAGRPIDLLFVNAGVTNASGPAGESWEDMSRVIEVNLRGALATVAVALPGFRQRQRGQVALVSSLAARVGMPITPTYAATKAALSSYGAAMRTLLAPQGIAVCVICPGFIDTPMSGEFRAGKPMMISAGEAAHRIRQGLANNRVEISFPWTLAAGMRLLSMLPPRLAQCVLRYLGYGR